MLLFVLFVTITAVWAGAAGTAASLFALPVPPHCAKYRPPQYKCCQYVPGYLIHNTLPLSAKQSAQQIHNE